MTSSNGNIFRVTGQWHGVFFDLRLNKWLSKQWWSWWFETPSRPLWSHFNCIWWIHVSIGYKNPPLLHLASYRSLYPQWLTEWALGQSVWVQWSGSVNWEQYMYTYLLQSKEYRHWKSWGCFTTFGGLLKWGRWWEHEQFERPCLIIRMRHTNWSYSYSRIGLKFNRTVK